MKAQHTPGPWSHIEDYGTPDGTPLRLVKSEREEIAFYVSEANAALIAAAPELLAALETCLRFLKEIQSGKLGPIDCDHEHDTAQEAIAKAGGDK